MLYMWYWEWLFWYNSTWLWDPYAWRTQPGQLHVSNSVLWHLSDVIQSLHLQTNRTNVSLLTRFFLMYLINKDETEHTGQVRHVTMFTPHHNNNEELVKHIGYACVFDRNHMCGRCTKRDAGISSLLETASENNMKTSLDKCNSVLYLVF